jgi:hypothetical protein
LGTVRVKSASGTGRVAASSNRQVMTGPATVVPTVADAGWLGVAKTVSTLGRVTRADTLCIPSAA